MKLIVYFWHKLTLQKREAISKLLFNNWLARKIIIRKSTMSSNAKSLTIEMTGKCNLRCSYCPKSLGVGGNGNHIAWESFTTIADNALDNGYKRFALNGFGEPTMHYKLVDAIAYIKSKNPDAYIMFNSNGTLLNEILSKKLIEAGLSQIVISINATSREQYQRINSVDLYDKVVMNAQTFLRLANDSSNRIRVILQVLGGKINSVSQLRSFQDYWMGGGGGLLGHKGSIRVQPPVNWTGTVDMKTIERREAQIRGDDWKEGQNDAEFSVLQNSEAIDDKKAYPCAFLFEQHFVASNGDAIVCCQVSADNQGDLKLGNIAGQTLHELYWQGKAKELRRKNLNGELYKLSPCNQCYAWQERPNVWLRNPLHPLVGTKWI
jgi:organic radical activating enzyme